MTDKTFEELFNDMIYETYGVTFEDVNEVTHE